MKKEVGQGAVVVLAVAIIAAIIGAAAVYFLMPMPPVKEKEEANVLTLYHWWTSGGEKAAIEALISVYKSKYPDVAVVQSPVAGGAGFVMKTLMKSLVLAGEAPDAFQMHVGYEGQPYYDAGYLEPITDLWISEGWADVMPSVLVDSCKFDDEFYMVPVNIHRTNVLWYNKTVLDAAGIDPATLTTWDAFFAACETLKTTPPAGLESPIAVARGWVHHHILEQIIAGEGATFYQDYVNGKVTSATDPKLLNALETYKTYLSYCNEDRESLVDWPEATAKVITGKAAFEIMGDWAAGEWLLTGKVFGTEWGAMAVPGTSGMWGLCSDAFQHCSGVAHPTRSTEWLKVVGSKEGQAAFNLKKGSIPARTDVDPTPFNVYQKDAMADFKAADHVFPSVAHGTGAPEAFASEMWDIAATFATKLDVSATAKAITDAVKAAQDDYVKVWAI